MAGTTHMSCAISTAKVVRACSVASVDGNGARRVLDNRTLNFPFSAYELLAAGQ